MDRRSFLRRAGAAATLAVAAPRPAFAQPASISFASSNATVGLVTQVVRRLNLEVKYDLKLDLKAVDLGDRVCVLSPRPSRIIADVPIEAPRTRVQEDPFLLDLERKILRALGVE